jgi:hypothetical protein
LGVKLLTVTVSYYSYVDVLTAVITYVDVSFVFGLLRLDIPFFTSRLQTHFVEETLANFMSGVLFSFAKGKFWEPLYCPLQRG